jgi:Polysaccharide biosynthesis enzyme WcbI
MNVGPSMHFKQKIAILGNCHSTVVSRIIKHLHGQDESLAVKVFKSHDPLSDDDRRWIAAADVIVKQTADFSKAHAEMHFERARVVPFPLITGQFLWPFNTKDHPRNAETITPWRKDGLFHFELTDSQIIRLMNERKICPNSTSTEIDALLDEYLELDYAKLLNLDRLLAISREKMSRATEIVGYNLWDIVERDFRSIPTFMTALHPERPLLQALCVELLPRLGFDSDLQAIRRAFDDVYEGEPIFAYGAPIHPSVMRHFGINWPTDPPLFRFWYDGFITARAFAERMVRLDSREPVRELFGRLSLGEPWTKILPELEELAPQQSNNSTFLLHYGNLLAKLGRDRDALVQYAAGLRENPANAALVRKLLSVVGKLGLTEVPLLEPNGETHRVTSGQNGVRFLGENWHLIDARAAWLRDYSGWMQFRIPRPSAGAIRLRFVGRFFTAGQPPLNVRILANGRNVGDWTLRNGHLDSEYAVILPCDAVSEGIVRLQFVVDKPLRPSDIHGTRDTRLFSLGLREFSAIPITNDSQGNSHCAL